MTKRAKILDMVSAVMAPAPALARTYFSIGHVAIGDGGGLRRKWVTTCRRLLQAATGSASLFGAHLVELTRFPGHEWWLSAPRPACRWRTKRFAESCGRLGGLARLNRVRQNPPISSA